MLPYIVEARRTNERASTALGGFVATHDQYEATLRDWARGLGCDLADERIRHAVAFGALLTVQSARALAGVRGGMCADVVSVLLTTWSHIEHLAPKQEAV